MSLAWVDLPAFAALLATEEYPQDACEAALSAFFEGEERSGPGRGIFEVTAALKARPALLEERREALLELISFTHEGAWCEEKGQRILGALGSPCWSTYDRGRLLLSQRFAFAELMRALHPHADAPEGLARDLARWLELGDREALGRLRPAADALASDPIPVPDEHQPTAVVCRTMTLLAAHLPDPEARLEYFLQSAIDSFFNSAVLLGIAALLAEEEGPATPPPWPQPGWENPDDKAARLALLEVLYRLYRDHRPLFDDFAPPLLNERPWRALEILGLLEAVEEERSVSLDQGKRFWRILRFGRCSATHWGKVGDAGTVRLKTWPDEARARKGVAAAHRKKLARPDAVDTTP